jgi:penicillin-binding protein 1C
MFDAFKLLPTSKWFDPPENNLEYIITCGLSGYKASQLCEVKDTIYATINADRTKLCPYHRLVHLDKTENFQVTSACYPVSEMVTKPWFVIPPVMEWYYKHRNPNYTTLPPLLDECFNDVPTIELIYPQQNQQVFIPKSFNGQVQKVVCKATHRQPKNRIFWHLDQDFLGTTENGIHQMEIQASLGKHTLTLMDETGNTVTRDFEVIGR